MIIVVDTNIIIAALIKDSTTRKIIIESGFDFTYPEPALKEILKYHQLILDKSGYTKKEFDIIFDKLLDYINLVPLEIIKPKIHQANKIIGKIDVNDVIFIATALALDNAYIWSDDSDFEKQNSVKILKTKDIIKIVEK